MEIELKIVAISDLLKPFTSKAMVLEEMYGNDTKRRLAIIISNMEAMCLRTCMVKNKTSYPLAYDLTAALLCEAEVMIEKAVIYKVVDGVYYSYIYGVNSSGKQFKIEAKAAESFALSFKLGFNVYITDELFEREQIHHVTPDGSGFSIPLNSVDTDMLKLELETAIENEDYERAAILRDEISRREHI